MRSIKRAARMFILAALIVGFTTAGFPAGETDESLWDSCDSLDVTAPIYNQPAWNPKAFESTRIGTVTIDTKEKIEGKGSIHWVVTNSNVQEMNKKDPTFELVALHKLYGQDWSPYLELKFNIKCESLKHPPVYCMLYGAGKFPSLMILDENEVTKGWKEIRWDLRKVDTGTDPKWGKLMNFFRVWTKAPWFKEGDTLDIYIDNLRLVTAAPQEK